MFVGISVWFFYSVLWIHLHRSWSSWFETGLSNSNIFKVSEKIPAYNQCRKPLLSNRTWSNRNLVLPEGQDFPSQKRAASSPQGPQQLSVEVSSGSLHSSLPLTVHSFYWCHDSTSNLVTRFHHSLQLFVDSSTDPQASLLAFRILHPESSTLSLTLLL